MFEDVKLLYMNTTTGLSRSVFTTAGSGFPGSQAEFLSHHLLNWRCRGLNPGTSAYKADDLPKNHISPSVSLPDVRPRFIIHIACHSCTSGGLLLSQGLNKNFCHKLCTLTFSRSHKGLREALHLPKAFYSWCIFLFFSPSLKVHIPGHCLGTISLMVPPSSPMSWHRFIVTIYLLLYSFPSIFLWISFLLQNLIGHFSPQMSQNWLK